MYSTSQKQFRSASDRDYDTKLILKWLQQVSVRRRRFHWHLVQQFLTFVDKPLAAVTKTDVKAFVAFSAARAIAPINPRRSLRVLKSLLRFMEELYIQDHKPTSPAAQGHQPIRKRTALISAKLQWGLGICLTVLVTITPKLLDQGQFILIQRPRLINNQEIAAVVSHLEKSMKSPHTRAFLQTVAWAEGTSGPEGYQTQFTGSQWVGLQDHPREINCGYRHGEMICSDAAGRYQFLSPTWDRMATKIGATDFSSENQDLAAVALIEEHEALEDVEVGHLDIAVSKLKDVWPSLHFEDSHVKSMAKLQEVYQYYLAIEVSKN